MSDDDPGPDDGKGRSEKITAALEREIEGQGPRAAAAREVTVRIHTARGRRQEAHAHAQRQGANVEASYGSTIITKIPAGKARGLAKSNAVELIDLHQEPEEHGTVSEGVEISGADLLHDIDLTGDGVEIAVIDGAFNTDNDKYTDRISGTIGDGIFDDDDPDKKKLNQHGTACAEIVADMAPDAELVLASTRGTNMSNIINTLSDDFDPDVATMSLGFPWNTRIDGKDDLSKLIENKFTSDGRLFATSAGNEANGDTWHGEFDGDVGDLLEFDSSGNTRLKVNTTGAWDSSGDKGIVYVHWDAPWDKDNKGYKVRLWSDPTSTDSDDLVAESQSNLPFESISFTDKDSPPVYLEVEHTGRPNDITGNEHFDMLAWRSKLSFPNFTRGHSIGRPATSRDTNTLAVAAVQATSTGIMPKAEYLKAYSSRGPTQRGRRGVDIAAPSKVSQLERNFFNGTSAASPHIGGAAGVLFESDLGASRDDIRDALFDAAGGIADPSVSDPGPNNEKIGFGYLDARGARDILEGIMVTLDEKWTYDTASRSQFATPRLDGNRVYAGGLDEDLFALARGDGSEHWIVTRDGAFSDSSPHLSDGTIYVGSGDGDLYAIDRLGGTVKWRYSTGSAMTASPVVAAGTVYCATNDATVHAVDAATGAGEWTASVPEAVYSEVAVAAGTVFVTTRDGWVVALDAADGDEEWSYDTGTILGSSSPTATSNTVYVPGSTDVIALNTPDGTVDWRSAYGGAVGSNPTLDTVNDRLYIGSTDGKLYAFDATDGTEKWRTVIGDGAPIAASPALAEERVIVATREGDLDLIDSALQPGDRIDSYALSSRTRSSPSVDANEVYIGSRSGRIFALSGS